MNKIEKFLRKLRSKEREAILLIMAQLQKNFRSLPHLKPLIGEKNLFRVRVGNYRIIFMATDSKVEIIRITKRDEQTYKNLN